MINLYLNDDCMYKIFEKIKDKKTKKKLEDQEEEQINLSLVCRRWMKLINLTSIFYCERNFYLYCNFFNNICRISSSVDECCLKKIEIFTYNDNCCESIYKVEKFLKYIYEYCIKKKSCCCSSLESLQIYVKKNLCNVLLDQNFFFNFIKKRRRRRNVSICIFVLMNSCVKKFFINFIICNNCFVKLEFEFFLDFVEFLKKLLLFDDDDDDDGVFKIYSVFVDYQFYLKNFVEDYNFVKLLSVYCTSVKYLNLNLRKCYNDKKNLCFNNDDDKCTFEKYLNLIFKKNLHLIELSVQIDEHFFITFKNCNFKHLKVLKLAAIKNNDNDDDDDDDSNFDYNCLKFINFKCLKKIELDLTSRNQSNLIFENLYNNVFFMPKLQILELCILNNGGGGGEKVGKDGKQKIFLENVYFFYKFIYKNFCQNDNNTEIYIHSPFINLKNKFTNEFCNFLKYKFNKIIIY